MVMLHNDRVGDIPTIQAAPPDEIHLAACVQNVHEMIMDHMALATLASHTCFSFPVPHFTLGGTRRLTPPLRFPRLAYEALALFNHISN
jgi:hypothetical protein